MTTEHGRVRLLRPSYYCAGCRSGHCPADRELGVGSADTTPAVQAKVTTLAAQVPYVQVSTLLRQLGLPFAPSIKSVEQIAQRLGTQLQQEPAVPQLARATRDLAVAADGTMLPTRRGSREVRCAVIYELDWEAGRTTTVCAGLRKEHLATTESRYQLMAAACARVERRRPRGAAVAALGDGAEWIWEGYAKYLPHRIEILDFYHVSERVAQIAAAWRPAHPVAGPAWRERHQKVLLRWGPRQLLNDLRCWRPRTEAAREVRRRQLGYFEKQQERMWYPTYLKSGLPIGSGAVEGACKHLVGDRFKGTGMRWKLETAEP